VVGGILSDTVGWRAIFLVNVPLAVISLAITIPLAPETPRKQRSGLDLTGQFSAIVALAALVYALIEGPTVGWTDARILGAFVLSLAALAVFVAAEIREGDSAMLPPRMFGDRGFSAALIAGGLANFGLSGLLFVLSLFFQEARGYSSLIAGLAFLPLTVPTAINPIFTGRLVGRIGPRRPATTGFVLMGIGALVQVPFTGNSAADLIATVIGLLAFGTGVSFALPALVAGVASTVPQDLAGIGAGALNSARQVGASLGVAVLGVALSMAKFTGQGTRYALVAGAVILLIGAVIAGTGLRGRPAK